MSVISCRIATGDEWDQALSSMDHDVYHRRDYCRTSIRQDDHTAVAALASDGTAQVLLPLIKRPLGEGLWDATSPYGYGGPVITRTAASPCDDSLLTDALAYLSDLGCVSLFLRLHPGLNATWPCQFTPTPETASSSPTVVLPVEVSEDDALGGMRQGHRYQVRLAQRGGYRVLEDVDGRYRRQFVDLYRANMTELGASDYYLFDDEYFDSLLDSADSTAHLWVAANGEGLGAAAVFTVVGDWVQYHLSATDPNHRRLSPGKLLIHAVRTELRGTGPKWLHLGGGVGGSEDSLFKFKTGFGGDQLTYRTAGLVLNREAYVTLTHARGLSGPRTHYFPLYRSP